MLPLLVGMWGEAAHVFGLSKVRGKIKQSRVHQHSLAQPLTALAFKPCASSSRSHGFLDSHLQELRNGWIFPGFPVQRLWAACQGPYNFWQSYTNIRAFSGSVWTPMNFKTAKSTLNRLIFLCPTQLSSKIIWNYYRAWITPIAYRNLSLPQPEHI